MRLRHWLGYAIKVAVSHSLYYTGVLHLVQRIRLKDKAVVLMYHRVLTPEQRRLSASQPGLIVLDSTFARQMAVVRRMFTVLSLDEFADRLERRAPFDGPCCLVTFDDGWVDNAENALPVLRAENIPAVIFLPVGFIGACRLFTREALTHLLVEAVKASRQDPEIRRALSGHLSPFGLDHVLDADEDAALQTAIEAVQVYRHANGPKFETLVANLCDVLKVSQEQLSDIDTFMDWTHVEQMGQQGVSFGGHGVHHRVLTEVDPDEARLEVETSKQALDARLPQPVRAFAYPNGGCNPRVAEIVDAVGYGLAFGVEPGFVACNDDRLRLRRINIHEDLTRSTPMFLARLAGIF